MLIRNFLKTAFALTALGWSAVVFGDGVVLITHANNSIDSVSASEAKAIFLGKRQRWESGEKIKLYVQKSGSVTNVFSSEIVNQTASQYSLYWRKKMFSGTGVPPREVSGDEGMVQAIASEPGAIGYVSASNLPDNVKVLAVL